MTITLGWEAWVGGVGSRMGEKKKIKSRQLQSIRRVPMLLQLENVSDK